MPEEEWHLSKAIPVSIIIYLTVQTIGAVWWFSKIDSRVSYLEGQQPVQDLKIERLENISSKIIIIEERQNSISKRLDIQTEKMDRMLDLIKKSVAP